MLLSMIGVLLLVGLGLELDLQYIMVAQVCIGLGSALFVAPNTNAIMGSVQVSEFSAAAGMVLSMAMCMSAITIFEGGDDMLGPAMYPDFLEALQVSMLFCAGLAVVGVLFSWFRGGAVHEGGRAGRVVCGCEGRVKREG
ncbi:MAG TPA: hypothetical protein O0X38_05155 [Methanocorpusculum sp.]|nr:hypothetical protein [Methanocorpusculum sp.]